MSRPVLLTAKQAGCYSARSMELTCSMSMQRFLQYGTNGFATCSRECPSAMKRLHWLDGRRAKEPSAIWANGTPIRKTTPTRLASIDRNGTICRPSVGISDQRSLSLLAEMPCTLSWCQVQAKDQHFSLWNSDTTNQCRPSVPPSSAWCAGASAALGRDANRDSSITAPGRQPDPPGRTAVGDLPGTAGQREAAAAQHGAARRRRVHCGGDVQEVPLTDHWTGATHYELHRPTGHGDVKVLCVHALDIQQHRDFGFQPLEQQRAADGTFR